MMWIVAGIVAVCIVSIMVLLWPQRDDPIDKHRFMLRTDPEIRECFNPNCDRQAVKTWVTPKLVSYDVCWPCGDTMVQLVGGFCQYQNGGRGVV